MIAHIDFIPFIHCCIRSLVVTDMRSNNYRLVHHDIVKWLNFFPRYLTSASNARDRYINNFSLSSGILGFSIHFV